MRLQPERLVHKNSLHTAAVIQKLFYMAQKIKSLCGTALKAITIEGRMYYIHNPVLKGSGSNDKWNFISKDHRNRIDKGDYANGQFTLELT